MSDLREYGVGDVTRMLGVTRMWILRREGDGTLPPPRRTPGGHRTYNTGDLHAIRELAVAHGKSVPDEGPARKPASLPSGTIAVMNQKGGVGKTTITQNLGLALANKGFRVLLVDLDKQFNLTTSFQVDIQEEEKGLGHVLYRMAQGDDPRALVEGSLTGTGHPHLDLIPNNLRMFDAELYLRNLPNGLNMLAKCLREVGPRYDFTLIDCPPDLGTLTINGIKASSALLIPVDGDFSLMGMRQLRRILDQATDTQGEIPILGVVVNRYDPRTVAHQYIVEKVEKNFPDLLFQTKIAQSVKLLESHIAKKPLLAYDPHHQVSRQFAALADEMVDRVRQAMNGGAYGA